MVKDNDRCHICWILLTIVLIYYILDIIWYVKCSLFAVSGLICVVSISLFGILFGRFPCKIVAVVKCSLLKDDSENNESFTPVNNT